jgi:ComF family protein
MKANTRSPLIAASRRLLQGVTALLYPPMCYQCGENIPPGVDFCDECLLDLTDDPHATCPHCAQTVGAFVDLADGCANCRSEDFRFDAAIRLGLYQKKLRDAVLLMKHIAGQDLSEAMGRLWASSMSKVLHALKVEAVVPMPLHWLRLWHRGYNQSDSLAEALAAELHVPYRKRWLRRRRSTPHQTGQTLTARRENVQGAFRARPRPELKGKTVLLVDDVMTSGSTCSEAARALKAAGAAKVVVAVLGRSEMK